MTTKKYHHGDLKNSLIRAGVDILAEDGIAGLSLRKVAQKAGVSHNAPYSHFTDKQALIAAISTEGYRTLYEQLSAVRSQFADDPKRQLYEAGFTYLHFAQTKPAHFKVTFSHLVERENDYPDLVEISGNCLNELIEIVRAGQNCGYLRPAPVEALAVAVWSAVHGFTSLLIEGQVSHDRLNRMPVDRLLEFTLDQFTVSDWAQDHHLHPDS
jgi:AcrR family transcriptional regulator